MVIATRSSLRRVIPLYIALGIALFSFIPIVSESVLVYRMFSRYETMDLVERRDQFRVLLDREHSALQSITKSYAEWDDSYEYMISRDDTYAEENYHPDWLDSEDIDLVLILAPDGELVWANTEISGTLRSDGRLFPPFEKDLLFSKDYNSLPPEPISGFLEYDGFPILYVSWPITDDMCTLPPRGALMFIRFLDSDVITGFAPGEGFSISYRSSRDMAAGASAEDSLMVPGPGKDLYASEAVRNPLGQIIGYWSFRKVRIWIDEAKSLIFWFVILGIIAGVGAYAVASISVTRRMVKPILYIRDYLDCFSESFTADTPIKAQYTDEIGDLTKHVNALIRRVEGQTKELDRLAGTDGLTGLPNRRRLNAAFAALEVKARIGRTEPNKRQSVNPGCFACGLIDVDFFKKYNDLYGHVEGDETLRRVAAAIQGGVKRPDDLPCRYGGEEFAVFLPDTDEAGALVVLERIRAAIEAFAVPHGGSKAAKVVTISAGVAAIASFENGLKLETILDQADKALYAAKTKGRNTVVAFSSLQVESDRTS
ncbi:MAG: diguanylate cyclase [Spirochaetales bacterium]|nr:diguanylate cyclase [Spirochaetales bacterium]